VSDYLAATLPEQPRNMRELRAWAKTRVDLADAHVADMCPDDHGLDECTKARGCWSAWIWVLARLERAVDLAEAMRDVTAAHDRAASSLDDASDLDQLRLAAQVEVYAEALETVASVPGVRA
jgi:hypothetical protein